MSNTLALILFVAALLVTAGLAWYALHLWREVGKRKAFRHDEDRRARQNSLENLELVASALLQEQVGVTEAAWRCRTLFDIIQPGLVDEPEFEAFAIVHSRTQHLHSHSARMELTPAQRREEDQERLKVEDEMREGMRASAKAALDFVAKKRQV